MTGFRSVGIPCFLWAGIIGFLTLLTMLQFDLGPVWSAILTVVATLVAGFGAWASYDLPGLLAAMKHSAKLVFNWRPDTEKLKGARAHVLFAISIWSTIASVTLLPFTMSAEGPPAYPTVIIFVSTLLFAVMSYGFVGYNDRQEKQKQALKLAKWTNPIGLVVGAFIVTFWCIRRVPLVLWALGVAARAIGRFCRLTFIQVNCSKRRARAFGTMTGVFFGCAIGSPLGSAALGSLACAAIGFLAGLYFYNFSIARAGELQKT